MKIQDLIDTSIPLPEQVKKQVEEFDQRVQEWFLKEGKLRFAEAFVINGSGKGILIAIDMPPAKGGSRDVLGDAIREAAGDKGTQAVLFVSEIWAADHDSFMKHMNITLDDIDASVSKEKAVNLIGRVILNIRSLYTELYGSMQKMPGACEKVWFSLETIWGNWAKFIDIVRDDDGNPILVPETNKWGKIKNEMAVEGRFADFLNKKKEYN